MTPEDLTKEQVAEMSDEEVIFWCKRFAEQEQAANMRKHMFDQIEIRNAREPRILPIHVESEVIG